MGASVTTKSTRANLSPSETSSSASPSSVEFPQDTPTITKKMDTNTSSLNELSSAEQKMVLTAISMLRKCGLEGVLSLPQLVVCGDQSAGKSSVLEALTEIPFPRNDNLCTRYATEIILRLATRESIVIRIIPDQNRPSHEQEIIRAFAGRITDFDELPALMIEANRVIGIEGKEGAPARAFARDVLSIEIAGPNRPQLTVVDLPGLIQNDTKGVTEADIQLVTDITTHYISQPRTICLAVVSALNDYANQSILRRVRNVDPEGQRTLGIITKPDRLEANSGSERAFIELAQNQDIHFDLGWHVLRNRNFAESSSSFADRNAAEDNFFRKGNFAKLPKICVGIDSLRERLSDLLFQHVRQELPKLAEELDKELTGTHHELKLLGDRRASKEECKSYLTNLSMAVYGVCSAAKNGHYEGQFFKGKKEDLEFSITSSSTIRRLRAVIQYMNFQFANKMGNKAVKYSIEDKAQSADTEGKLDEQAMAEQKKVFLQRKTTARPGCPVRINKKQALIWIKARLSLARGQELYGNYNPLLIADLYWEQSEHWVKMGGDHYKEVASVCERFLQELLQQICPKDVYTRLWNFHISTQLRSRLSNAQSELDELDRDHGEVPMNYNHYYTDTIKAKHREREGALLGQCVEKASAGESIEKDGAHQQTIDVELLQRTFQQLNDPNMENYSCEEILDCLDAIYKTELKVFVANLTKQVVERHIVRGIEEIFSPVMVNGLSESELLAWTAEPASVQRKREYLDERMKKLQEGHNILETLMRNTAA
ncbi:hypothetical protein MMC25_005035 [Agyrium rufum]|nr:hypothetical protein [Agyrium rufum]